MASTAKRKTSPASFLLKLREVLAREDPAVISWDGDGKITIGDPKRLGDEVLTRYFRHGNFSSFQRQLNYFGYYKVQGKGRLSACVYTNDALAAAAQPRRRGLRRRRLRGQLLGARPLRVSSRRRRLGRLLRPLLRAQGGLQRRRRGRRAVAQPSTPSTRYIYHILIGREGPGGDLLVGTRRGSH